MRLDSIRTGLLAAFAWLLVALVPGGAAEAQVTCPSAANDETLNIVTTGGMTTCTNIGTAAATEGIEIRNNLVKDYDIYGPGTGGTRFGVAIRRITASGNEQPSGASCIGDCFGYLPYQPFDEDEPGTSSIGVAADWGYGTGTSTLLECGATLATSSVTTGCTISFQFADGTQGSFSVALGSSVIPSFSLGGTLSFAPAVTSVTPASGPEGTTVTIRGSYFDNATAVHFREYPYSSSSGGGFSSGIPAASFQVISSTEILAVAPVLPVFPSAAGFGETTAVTVTTSIGKGGLDSAFMFRPPTLTIITTSLPAATAGTSYSTTFSASGGNPSISYYGSPAGSYAFSATGLPAGLTLATNGSLTGIPTATGTFTVNVTVTDTAFRLASSTTATKTFNLTVAPAVSVTTTSLTAGTVGTAYTAPLAASGGTAPYSFTATGLPGGLAVSGASITGTPTQAGTFTVAITATDATTGTPLVSPTVNLHLTIAQAAQTIAFTSTPPASPAPGSTYAATATGGASGNPVTFAIDAASTSGACTISGATVSFAAAGTCIVNANQAGNANYLAAAQVQQSFTVQQRLPQAITFTSTPRNPAPTGSSYTVAATGGASGNAITFAIDPGSTSGACTISGSTVSFAAAGTCVIAATQAGNATYAAGTAQQTVTVAAVTPVVSVIGGNNQSGPANGTFPQPIRLKLVAQGTSTPLAGWTINFFGPSINGPTAFLFLTPNGPGLISATTDTNGEVSLIAKANSFVGSYAISANVTGGNTATFSLTNTASGQFTVTAGSTPQTTQVNTDFPNMMGGTLTDLGGAPMPGVTISFLGPGSGATGFLFAPGSSTATASAVTGSDGRFTLRVRANALIGTYTIRATIPGVGTSDYVFTNTGIPQVINFTSTPPSPASVGATYAVTATGGASGNPVTFAIDSSSTSGACTISGSTVTFAGAGTCKINANQTGNSTYLAAAQVQQTINVTKVAQTISFTKPADRTFVLGETVALSASATSSLPVTLTSTTTGVCTVAGTTATIAGAGTCSITASQAGNATYAAAPDVVHTFAVGKAPQTITFTRPADIVFTPGATVALTASASSGLAVTLASETTAVCTLSGATATFVTAGTCTIKASQAGNANYQAAPDVRVSFGALAPPSISATATVTPTSFSKPGTLLSFTFTLTNAGGVAATGLVVRDARLGTLACAATTIAPVGGTTTCTGSTTAADLAARRITIAPQVTYTYAPPPPPAVTTAARGTAAAPSTITVTVSLAVTVTAAVDVAAVQAATKSAIQGLMSTRANLLTTSGPDTARAHSRLGAGTLFGGADAGNAPSSGFADDERGVSRPRTGLGAFGRNGALLGYDGSRPTGGSVAGGMSLNGLTPGFDADSFGQRAGLGRTQRGPLAMSLGRENATFGGPFGVPFGWQRDYPDAANDNQRLGSSAFRFSGNAEDGMGRFAFATSLAQMRAAAEAQDQARRASAGFSPAGAPAPGREGPAAPASPDTHAQPGLRLTTSQGLAAPASSAGKTGSVDIWVEGTSSYFTTNRIDGRRQGHAAVAHAGIDMIVAPGLLVGVMGSYDWVAETASTVGGNRDGRGWMAGPYLSARLTRNLYFDARYAWGQSTNHIDPLGAYVDTFSTTRQLASAKLTGDWSWDALRFRPSAEVIWFSETQKAYVNQVGIDIAANTFSLGRAMFGPEVGYRLQLSDKSVLEPFIGLKGVWDFARTEETTAAGTPIGSNDIRGRVEAGLSYRAPNGITIRGSGAYDGIGSDSHRTVQGQARLVLPLQ